MTELIIDTNLDAEAALGALQFFADITDVKEEREALNEKTRRQAEDDRHTVRQLRGFFSPEMVGTRLDCPSIKVEKEKVKVS